MEEMSKNITGSIVDTSDIRYNSINNDKFIMPLAPPKQISSEVPIVVSPIVVSPKDTFSSIKSEHPKEDKVDHHPDLKKSMKNPLVITCIALSAIIVVLVIVLILIIVLGKQTDSDDGTSGTSGGNKGQHKWMAFRYHHKNNPRNRFEHGNNHDNKNDPSGWQLYTLEGCGYCTKQMKELKGFNTYVKYERGNQTPIVNNISGELYPREKMTGFPLWYNSNTKEVKMGFQQDICNLSPKISTC